MNEEYARLDFYLYHILTQMMYIGEVHVEGSKSETIRTITNIIHPVFPLSFFCS